MTHFTFVTLSYLISALAIAGLAVWILLDYRGRKRDLAALEQAGIHRRSERA